MPTPDPANPTWGGDTLTPEKLLSQMCDVVGHIRVIGLPVEAT